jgi:hypothetical protein
MRAPRPGSVRAPWCSSPSWPLQVQKVDSIHWRTAPRLPWRRGSFLAVGAQERRAGASHEVLEFGAGEVLVGDHGVAGDRDAVEHLGGDDPLADVGGRELPADRHPVAGADEIQPKPPKPA